MSPRPLLALALALALTGCPEWSRPDPRARRAAAPEPPTTVTETKVEATPAPVGLAGLRDGVRRLREAPATSDRLADLERLETLGFDLLERGTEAEQREAEALLQELGDLRVQVVGG
jgi:hypothetical protein